MAQNFNSNQLSTDQLLENKRQAVLHVLNVRIAMMKHCTEQYLKSRLDDPRVIELLFDAFSQSVNGGFLEHIEKCAFILPLLTAGVSLGQMNWFDMTEQLLTLLPVANNFPIIRSPKEGLIPLPSYVFPVYPMFGFFNSVSTNRTFSKQTNINQFPTQMPTGNMVVPSNGAHVVNFRPVVNIPKETLDGWEKMYIRDQAKTETCAGSGVVSKSTQTEDKNSGGDHMKRFLLDQLEKHQMLACNSEAANRAVDYIDDALNKMEAHRNNGSNTWALDNMHLAEEYWAAVELYEYNVCIKEPLSIELAIDCSRRRICELATENNRNGIMISRAYIFALSTMSPALARDINAVMSFQSDTEKFERLENYFAQRYERQMIQLN